MVGSRANKKNRDRNTGSKSGITDQIVSSLRCDLDQMFSDAYGNMQPHFSDWEAFFSMYEGTYQAPDIEGPFADLHVALSAKRVNRDRARLRKASIPDRGSMKFFIGMVQPSNKTGESPENMLAATKAVEGGIQHDLIISQFATVHDHSILNALVTGNYYQMVSWDLKNKKCMRREVDPLYMEDPKVLEAMGYTFEKASPDSEAVLVWSDPEILIEDADEHGPELGEKIRVIPKYRSVPRTIKEYDAPRVVNLNPFNVFPTEMDKNSAEECTGVFIYDSCKLSDLREDLVQEFGGGRTVGNYTNLDGIVGTSLVPTVLGREMNGNTQAPMSRSLNRCERITYYGAIEWCDACESLGIEQDGPEWLEFLKTYNADPVRAANCKTWVVEFVGGKNGTLGDCVRCQPLPYDFDRIPIVHHRANYMPNRTIGFSDYVRTEIPERAYNHFLRMLLEQMQNLSNPPIIAYYDLIDPEWLQMSGGFASLEPGMIIPGINGANGIQPVMPLKPPSEGVGFCQQAMALMSGAIESQTTPGVVSGNVGSDSSAREISAGVAGVDLVDDAQAEDVGDALARMLKLLHSLNLQYQVQPKVVNVPGEDGKPEMIEIPQEVWERDCIWFLTGAKTMANKETHLQALEMLAEHAKESGRLDYADWIKRVAELVGLQGVGSLVGPEPPPEKIPARLALAATVAVEKEHPVIKEAIFKAGGVELPDNAVQLMTDAAQVTAGIEHPDALNQPPPQQPGQLQGPEGGPNEGMPMEPDALPTDGMFEQPPSVNGQGETPTGLTNIEGSL